MACTRWRLGKRVNGLPHLGCTLGLALGGGGALSLCVCPPHGLCYSWVCLQLSQDHSRYVQYICLAASHCVSANPPTVQPTLHLNMRPALSLKTRTAAFWSGRARHLFEGVKEGKLAHTPLVETTHESVKLFRGRYIRQATILMLHVDGRALTRQAPPVGPVVAVEAEGSPAQAVLLQLSFQLLLLPVARNQIWLQSCKTGK